MTHPAARLLLIALGLSALPACSRTADGTVVPSYRMKVDSFAGIPLLRLRRRPLEGPDPFIPPPQPAQDLFPPAPPSPAAAAVEPRPAAPRRQRAVSRRPRPAAAPAGPLTCRNAEPEGRPVRIVCE